MIRIASSPWWNRYRCLQCPTTSISSRFAVNMLSTRSQHWVYCFWSPNKDEWSPVSSARCTPNPPIRPRNVESSIITRETPRWIMQHHRCQRKSIFERRINVPRCLRIISMFIDYLSTSMNTDVDDKCGIIDEMSHRFPSMINVGFLEFVPPIDYFRAMRSSEAAEHRGGRWKCHIGGKKR